MTMDNITGYIYCDSKHSCAHFILMPPVFNELNKLDKSKKGGARLFDLGFADLRFKRVGRIPLLAKSMIVTARKP